MTLATEHLTPVGLTAEQLRLLLDTLDADAPDSDVQKRKSRRLPFRSLNVLVQVLDAQGRVQASLRVATRNISASGLAFLGKNAMTPGQVLRFEIPVLDDQLLCIPAQVARCRCLQQTVHEIGAKFVGQAEYGALGHRRSQ